MITYEHAVASANRRADPNGTTMRNADWKMCPLCVRWRASELERTAADRGATRITVALWKK